MLENDWCKKIDDPRKISKNETPYNVPVGFLRVFTHSREINDTSF